VVALLVLLATLPSWPWLDNPFLRDDEALVASNPAVRTRLPVHRYFVDPGTFSRLHSFNQVCYRPLTPLTFAWDAAREGLTVPRGYRRTNLLLHALTVLLVLGFLRALLREFSPDTSESDRDRLALAVAALFAVHPYAAFTAQYVSNRSLLFMTLGSFATLWSYVAAWSSSRPALAHARTAACFALALCGKENGITLAAAVLLLELLRPGQAPGWRRVGGMGLGAIAYLGLRASLGLGSEQTNAPLAGVEGLGYVLGQLRVQWGTYLPAVVWPEPIRWEPLGPPGTLADPLAWLALAATGALLTLAFRRRHQDPVQALALLAYPLPQLPTMLMAQPLPALFYRPYPGLPFLFLAALWPLRRRLHPGVLAAAVLLAGGASYRVGLHQRTASDTWLHSIEYGAVPRAHFFLAGQVSDVTARREAYDRVIRRYPEFVRTYAARAKERLFAGDFAGALADLEQALRREARDPDYYLFTAVAARAAGRGRLEEQALRELRALGRHPSWAAVVGFAERAIQEGSPALARDALVLMGERDDVPWIVPYVRAVAHHHLGELDPAVAAYRLSLPGAREAGAPRVARNLGMALRQQGRCDAARPLLEEVLRAAPGDPVARRELDLCGP
jgi:tetratricopeptide (TPR) repeat protein